MLVFSEELLNKASDTSKHRVDDSDEAGSDEKNDDADQEMEGSADYADV